MLKIDGDDQLNIDTPKNKKINKNEQPDFIKCDDFGKMELEVFHL